MAFKWDGITRVYKTDKLKVFSKEVGNEWEYSNFSWGQNIECIYLFFQIESNYLQRVSPESNSGNDWLDIQNSIINGKDVTFYPIYSVDPSITYDIISNAIGERQQLLETDRAIFKPEVALNVKPKSSLPEYPDWLKITRYKP